MSVNNFDIRAVYFIFFICGKLYVLFQGLTFSAVKVEFLLLAYGKQ
jgi:hypothetical protein